MNHYRDNNKISSNQLFKEDNELIELLNNTNQLAAWLTIGKNTIQHGGTFYPIGNITKVKTINLDEYDKKRILANSNTEIIPTGASIAIASIILAIVFSHFIFILTFLVVISTIFIAMDSYNSYEEFKNLHPNGRYALIIETNSGSKGYIAVHDDINFLTKLKYSIYKVIDLRSDLKYQEIQVNLANGVIIGDNNEITNSPIFNKSNVRRSFN